MHNFDTDGLLPEVPFDSVTKIQEVLDAGEIELNLEDLTPAQLASKARAYNVFAHVLQMLHDPEGSPPQKDDYLIPIRHHWTTPLAEALKWSDLCAGVSDDDAHRETGLIAHLMGFREPNDMGRVSALSNMLMGFLIIDEFSDPSYPTGDPSLDEKLRRLISILELTFSGARLLDGDVEEHGELQPLRMEARLAKIGYNVKNVEGTGTFVRVGGIRLTPEG
ncbi:hypothetical protein [Kocuria rosea]|uniref:Uncharacterized protein n=1 Tax=Kocuria rosea TaxID=1275 RepID=A0A4R5YGN6_KOCRO|nr:hypothetical protein [Kocuria rosea]TDL42463.1 hypothetical protein E2R59_10990 [Kocuria rosea]